MGNRNWIFAAIILVVAGIGALLWFEEEAPPPADLKAKCCQECLDAFNQSPVGVGAGAAQCGEFTTAQPLSEACQEYFRENPVTVAECEGGE